MDETVPDRGVSLLAVNIAFLSVAVVAVALRCYTRIGVVRAFGLDDWVMLFAALSFIIFVVCSIFSVHYGLGKHKVDLSDDDFSHALKYYWLCYLWYGLTMVSSKISIGIFFLRLTVRRIHTYLVYLVLAITISVGICFFFVSLMQCNPASYFWDKDQEGWCIRPIIIAGLFYPYSFFSLFCDATFAILPIFMIRGLQMDRQTKFALIPILGLGWIASIAVLVRFAYIMGIADPDYTWTTLDVAIWSATEQGLAITAGSLATLRPLFRTVAQRLGVRNASTNPPSDAMQPPTIGGGSTKTKTKTRKSYDRGSFGLTTFLRGDVESGERGVEDNSDEGVKGDGYIKVTTTTSTVATDIEGDSSKDVFGASRDHTNDSQQELHSRMSKETLGTHGALAVPASFLAKEGGSRDSGSA